MTSRKLNGIYHLFICVETVHDSVIVSNGACSIKTVLRVSNVTAILLDMNILPFLTDQNWISKTSWYITHNQYINAVYILIVYGYVPKCFSDISSADMLYYSYSFERKQCSCYN